MIFYNITKNMKISKKWTLEMFIKFWFKLQIFYVCIHNIDFAKRQILEYESLFELRLSNVDLWRHHFPLSCHSQQKDYSTSKMFFFVCLCVKLIHWNVTL